MSDGTTRLRVTREQVERARARLSALAERRPEPLDFSKQEAVEFLLPELRRCNAHSLAAVLDELNGGELDYTLSTLKSCRARALKATARSIPPVRKPAIAARAGGGGGNDQGDAVPARSSPAPSKVTEAPAVVRRPLGSSFEITPT